ncbi:hypothetical protein BDZ45DRAFT_506123 [Acephala macrosclerotiorum]|nr:hypothetical protein BDZ45DRAFT_506123 [Acephala macrosclerotiorum]
MSSSSSGAMDGASGTGNPRSRMEDDGPLSFDSNNAQTTSTPAPIPQQQGQENTTREDQQTQTQSSTHTTAPIPRWIIPQRRQGSGAMSTSSTPTNNTRNLDGFNDASVPTSPSREPLTRGRGVKVPAIWYLLEAFDKAEKSKQTLTADGLLDDEADIANTDNDPNMKKMKIPAIALLFDDNPSIDNVCRNCGDWYHQTSACTENCGKCGNIDHQHRGATKAKGCCPNIRMVCGCEIFPGHLKEDCQEKCSYFYCNMIGEKPHTIRQCTVRCFKCGSFKHLGNVCPNTNNCTCGRGQHYGIIHGRQDSDEGCMITGCGLFFCTVHCDTCGIVKSLHPQGICTSTVEHPWFVPIPRATEDRVSAAWRWRTLICSEQKHEYAFGDPDGCWLCVHEKTSQIKHMAIESLGIDADDQNWKERLDTLLNIYGGGDWAAFIRWQEGNKELAERLIKGQLLTCKMHTSTTYDFDAPNGCPQCHTEKPDEIKQLAIDQEKWQQRMNRLYDASGSGDRIKFLQSIAESGEDGKKLARGLLSNFDRTPKATE